MNYGMILLLVCVFLGISAQLLLKSGVDNSDLDLSNSENIISKIIKIIFTPNIFAGFILYGISAVAWLFVLSKYELSFAYPMLALMYIFIPLAASFFLKEQINAMQWVGITIVTIGVLVISQANPQL